ncbi:hypothetical protein HOA92_03480 [archaeon]|nr:hypothetical protein [archaeon]MBT6762073.1 hypothetical protein [archaeon]
MVEDSTINIEDEENLIYNLVDQIYATGTTLDSAIQAFQDKSAYHRNFSKTTTEKAYTSIEGVLSSNPGTITLIENNSQQVRTSTRYLATQDADLYKVLRVNSITTKREYDKIQDFKSKRRELNRQSPLNLY